MEEKNRILSQNLQRYMSEFDEIQLDVAKTAGVSPSTVSLWINGNAYPRIDKLIKLAAHYNCEVADLISSPKRLIPVYASVNAGFPSFADNEIVDWEEVSSSMFSSGELRGIKVKGDSMYPDFMAGDTVIVRVQDTAEDGDIVVVLIGEEATLKELQKSSRGITLIPHNTSYPSLWYSNEQIKQENIRIFGKVVESRRRW